MKPPDMMRVLREIHEDERGVVSLETILIVGAIALPILIFLIKIGWPRVRGFFVGGLDELQSESSAASQ